MSQAKGIAVAVVVILVIGVLAGGGAYLASKSKQKRAGEELKRAKDLLENGDQGLPAGVGVSLHGRLTITRPSVSWMISPSMKKPRPFSRISRKNP